MKPLRVHREESEPAPQPFLGQRIELSGFEAQKRERSNKMCGEVSRSELDREAADGEVTFSLTRRWAWVSWHQWGVILLQQEQVTQGSNGRGRKGERGDCVHLCTGLSMWNQWRG